MHKFKEYHHYIFQSNVNRKKKQKKKLYQVLKYGMILAIFVNVDTFFSVNYIYLKRISN